MEDLTKVELAWRSQVYHLWTLGYEFQIRKNEILNPDEAKLKLGPALLVDYETPIKKQCQLLGIKNYLDLRYHRNVEPKPQGRWGWLYGVEDGKKIIGRSPNGCMREFGRSNRRDLMTVEGLALYRENPGILRHRYVDLFGSWCDKFGAFSPRLCLHQGVPSLVPQVAGPLGRSDLCPASKVVVG